MQSNHSARPEYSGRGLRFALIAARFHPQVVDALILGAVDTLVARDVVREQIEIVPAPGAWEIPLIAQRLAKSGRYDAVIALGAVIRGDTAHFEYVAGECARGLQDVMLRCDVPVAFGVLTTDHLQQALDRAGGRLGNKGGEAALAALEMAHVLRGIGA